MLSEPLDIVVETGAAPEEMEAVVAVFEGVGVRANIRDDYMRLGAGDLPWVVEFIKPLRWVALAFVGGAAGKAGADTWDAYREGGWRGVQEFIGDVVRARGNDPDGYITVRDPTGPDVRLWQGIPDDAIRALADLDWGAMSGGYLGWSDERGEWRFLHGERAREGAPAPRRVAS